MRRWPTLRATGLLALGCNTLLELSRLAGLDGWPWRFKTPAFPLLFALGTLVLWLVAGLVQAVVGRLAVTRAAMLSATVLVALVDHEKVRLRDEPLYPGDLVFATEPGLLLAIVGGARVLVLSLLGASLVGLVLAAGRHRRRTRARPADPPGPPGPPGPALPLWRRVTARVAVAALCLGLLAYAAQFNEPGNLVRAAYDRLGAQWRPWSQYRNYLGNGFVAGVLYNTGVPAPAPPAGYGAATMAQVAARYESAADRINRRRDGSVEGVNVVMVLSESFSDPLRLRGVRAADPIPFTRALMARTTSGRMLSQSIGGGTANMEFEALTGLSLALLPPQLRVPYQSLVADRETFPSLVRWYAGAGHRAVAVHPFTAEMYRRRDVYAAFGFDAFLSEEDIASPVRLGRDGYVSDASAFAQARALIEESASPVFVNLVTMQNHIPYDDRYRDPPRVLGPDGEPLPEAGQYLRGLELSDAALRTMVRELARSPEPTVLVLYGDHLPGTWPVSVRALNAPQTMRETPYLVWSNTPTRVVRQPFTAPAHVTDLVLEQLDAPVPPYLALLTLLRREVPALAGALRYDPEGRVIAPGGLSARARRLLRDYRLVQYDLVAGRRYAEGRMLGTPGSARTGAAEDVGH